MSGVIAADLGNRIEQAETEMAGTRNQIPGGRHWIILASVSVRIGLLEQAQLGLVSLGWRCQIVCENRLKMSQAATAELASCSGGT